VLPPGELPPGEVLIAPDDPGAAWPPPPSTPRSRWSAARWPGTIFGGSRRRPPLDAGSTSIQLGAAGGAGSIGGTRTVEEWAMGANSPEPATSPTAARTCAPGRGVGR
jgi:hypothetical protein